MTEPVVTAAYSVYESPIDTIIGKWSKLIDSNNRSALRLAESGFYEQAYGCCKVNHLIERFIEDLKSLQH